jgi:hypothetical protein
VKLSHEKQKVIGYTVVHAYSFFWDDGPINEAHCTKTKKKKKKSKQTSLEMHHIF